MVPWRPRWMTAPTIHLVETWGRIPFAPSMDKVRQHSIKSKVVNHPFRSFEILHSSNEIYENFNGRQGFFWQYYTHLKNKLIKKYTYNIQRKTATHVFNKTRCSHLVDIVFAVFLFFRLSFIFPDGQYVFATKSRTTANRTHVNTFIRVHVHTRRERHVCVGDGGWFGEQCGRLSPN